MNSRTRTSSTSSTFRLWLLGVATAALTAASPIYINGGGTYLDDVNSAYTVFDFHFDGTADDDPARNVRMHGTCSGAVPVCLHLYTSTGSMGVMIDNAYFGQGFYSFSLVTGVVTGYNTQHQAVVTEEVDGVTTVTSRVCDTPLPTHICTGAFTITPRRLDGVTGGGVTAHAPEPATAGMVGVGVVMGIGIGVWRKWRRRR